jgi:hypothetical protein
MELGAGLTGDGVLMSAVFSSTVSGSGSTTTTPHFSASLRSIIINRKKTSTTNIPPKTQNTA